MRMLIAEPIQTLEYLRDSGAFPFSTKEGVLYTEESINIALETMRKYQKIQEIAEKCNLKLLPKEGMSTFMKDVLEVLEDGNDD